MGSLCKTRLCPDRDHNPHPSAFALLCVPARLASRCGCGRSLPVHSPFCSPARPTAFPRFHGGQALLAGRGGTRSGPHSLRKSPTPVAATFSPDPHSDTSDIQREDATDSQLRSHRATSKPKTSDPRTGTAGPGDPPKAIDTSDRQPFAPSELVQKYRTTPLKPEELELVGFPPSSILSSTVHPSSFQQDISESDLQDFSAETGGAGGYAAKSQSQKRPRGRPRSRPSTVSPKSAMDDSAMPSVVPYNQQKQSNVESEVHNSAYVTPLAQGDLKVHKDQETQSDFVTEPNSLHSVPSCGNSKYTDRRTLDGSDLSPSEISHGGTTPGTSNLGYPKLSKYPKRSVHVPMFSPTTTSASRFPSTWSSVVRQASDALMYALRVGHDRLTVRIKKAGLLPKERFPPLDVVSQRIQTNQRKNGSPDPEATRMTASFALALDISNVITSRLLAGIEDVRSFKMAPDAVIKLWFNNQEDANCARAHTHPAAAHVLEFHVLNCTEPPHRRPGDVNIIINPSNRKESLALIEAVELVHYCSWNESNIVIMLNPDLVAVTSLPSSDGGCRTPGFLKEYVPAFELDPCVFQSKTITGAVLRCYPRRWETYMVQSKVLSSFRLVSESESWPSAEKILSDFAQRMAKEDFEGSQYLSSRRC